MLSPDGKCYVFDRRANGMVPGEAVAVVVLKRLSRALADGDPIHAVIRGSGINYDGKTNGITAPSGASQAELLRHIYRECRLEPRDIDYIVTHGTATQLGDPVEVNALYDVFKSDGGAPGHCALTSIKSNLGHTFAASGLVSLISLVQAMRHDTIPASLHCEQVNEYIRWRESPFYVNKQAKPWTQAPGRPRIGAVSAFGISGTNAHMVLQDHVPAPAPAGAAPCYVLALSARTASALQDHVRQVGAWLQTQQAEQAGLEAISYTLLQGRHHFEHRCAIVVRDVREAAELWNASLGHHHGIVPREFSGETATHRAVDDLIRQAAGLAAEPDRYRETLLTLAEAHCRGYEVPWDALHSVAPRRISLPGYPFAREHCWIDEPPAPAAPEPAPPALELTPTDDALSYLEMARRAAHQALGQPIAALANMVWGSPRIGGESIVTLHGSGAERAYSIASADQADICHHLGEIVTASVDAPAPVNLARLRAGMKPPAWTLPDRMSVGVTHVYANAAQLVATLTLPADLAAQGMVFQPHVISAAWQLAQRFAGATAPLLPQSLRRIEAARAVPEHVTLHLARKPETSQTFDMTFYDTGGNACLRLRDFTLAPEAQLFDIPFQPVS
jgi:polyketide synthase PksN